MGFRVKTFGNHWFDCEVESHDPALIGWDDANRVLVARLISSWLAFLADSPLVSLSGHLKEVRTLRDFRKRALTNLKSTIVDLSDLFDTLTNSMEVDQTLGSIKIPLHKEFSKTPVFKEYEFWYKTGDAEVFQYLSTFLCFGKKAEIQDDTLTATAFRSWLGVEERLRCLQLPGWCKNLGLLAEQFLQHLPFDHSWPSFGPKSVAERGVRGRYAKAYQLELPEPIQELFQYMGQPRGAHIELSSYTRPSIRHCSLVSGLANPFGIEQILVHQRSIGSRMDRSRGTFQSASTFRDRKEVSKQIRTRNRRYNVGVGRLHFVPKNIKTERSICMEPNSYMFAQQAIRRSVESVLRTGPLGRFVSIHDQRPNQSLAQYGSLYGTIDTTDLSRASDSVSWPLIRAVLPLDWVRVLELSRSTMVEQPDGTLLEVLKYAPMGSALCFPVQCIIYSLVCVYAAILWKRGYDASDADRISSDDPLLVNAERALRLFRRRPGLSSTRLEPLRIYGDDILTDTRITRIVTSLLTSLGFEVNFDKSFEGRKCYRESCGKHYLEGSDVTPLYFRIKEASEFLTPGYLASATELANHAKERGYKFLRKYLIHTLRTIKGSYGGRAILFSNDVNDSCSIFTDGPVSYVGRKVRWNSDWQQLEVRTRTVVGGQIREPKPFEIEAGERYLYLQWLGQALRRPEDYDPMDSEAAVRHDTLGSALDWRWTPID
jgi:hypothetical protein